MPPSTIPQPNSSGHQLKLIEPIMVMITVLLYFHWILIVQISSWLARQALTALQETANGFAISTAHAWNFAGHVADYPDPLVRPNHRGSRTYSG